MTDNAADTASRYKSSYPFQTLLGFRKTEFGDGLARFERGLVRAEDAVSDRAPDPDAPESWSEPETQDGETAPPATEAEADEGLAPLSERLVIDLTAHRTMGLRDAVGCIGTV